MWDGFVAILGNFWLYIQAGIIIAGVTLAWCYLRDFVKRW